MSIRTRKWFVAALIFLAQTSSADYQSGLDAYNQARYTTAMEEWKAIIAGTPVAVPRNVLAETNFAIGMLYWMGQGVEVDFGEAYGWLHRAAEMGHAGAQVKLGYMYAESVVVDRNYETAFKWFSKAAKQGDIDGQYNLGIFYLNGWGTEQNRTMAAQYLAAASAQGDQSAEQALQELMPTLGLEVTESATESESEIEPLIKPESWILKQNPDNYTIQVIGLSSKKSLENLIQGYDHLAPFATYTLQRNNQALHLLVQGVYTNVESARQARDNFPRAIQKPKDVWIRQFRKVQELLQASK